jgi:hypothetical protein
MSSALVKFVTVGEGEERIEGIDDPHSTIALTQSMPPDQVISFVSRSKVQHVVQQDGLAFESEKLCAEIMVQKPSEFMSDPINVILGGGQKPVGALDLSVKCGPDEKKAAVLLRFENFLTSLSGSKSIQDSAILVADELFTNAAKNAWNSTARQPDSGPIRRGDLHFFAKSDGSRLVIGCSDSFGELSLTKVLSRIGVCFTEGVARSINQGQGGAGIGSFLVFNSSISYYLGVNRGQQSVVCAAFPLAVSNREFTELPKNIHLLSLS